MKRPCGCGGGVPHCTLSSPTSIPHRAFYGLGILILVTFLFNGYTLFLFLHDFSGVSTDILEGDNPFNANVIYNHSVPSLRFKVCDNDPTFSAVCDNDKDNMVILISGTTSPEMVEIAQTVRTLYKDGLQNESSGGSNSGRGRGRVGGRVVKMPISVSRLQRHLKPITFNNHKSTQSLHDLWGTVIDWPFSDSLRFMTLGQVIHSATSVPILNATNASRGTQLKVELTLEGGQVALWKPRWYAKDLLLEGTPYGGKDRHYGEVAAFYLNLLLGYNNAPITTGRKLNLKRDIYDVASPQLKNTFFRQKDGTLCFYGVCPYCSKNDFVCGGGNNGNELDGALVLFMQRKFQTVSNPWRRTYKVGTAAVWELRMDFCTRLMRDITNGNRNQLILDVVGVSIFDFLIGNGDRHHLEMHRKPNPDTPLSHANKVFLFDNGKSFGNPSEDYFDILAPLFQCCKIRESLYTTLKRFEGQLGQWLDLIMKDDPLHPLLSEEHLTALDRRLRIVLATIRYCKESAPKQNIQSGQLKKVFY